MDRRLNAETTWVSAFPFTQERTENFEVRGLGFLIYKMPNVPSNISREVTDIPKNSHRIPKPHFISYTKM